MRKRERQTTRTRANGDIARASGSASYESVKNELQPMAVPEERTVRGVMHGYSSQLLCGGVATGTGCN